MMFYLHALLTWVNHQCNEPIGLFLAIGLPDIPSRSRFYLPSFPSALILNKCVVFPSEAVIVAAVVTQLKF